MGRVLANVAASFVHNLLRPAQEPAYLERAVVSDEPISEAGRDKFLAIAVSGAGIADRVGYLSYTLGRVRAKRGRKEIWGGSLFL